MHDCLECGHACYCDMDDCWFPTPRDCCHHCEPEPDVDPYDEIDDPAPAPSGQEDAAE